MRTGDGKVFVCSQEVVLNLFVLIKREKDEEKERKRKRNIDINKSNSSELVKRTESKLRFAKEK